MSSQARIAKSVKSLELRVRVRAMASRVKARGFQRLRSVSAAHACCLANDLSSHALGLPFYGFLDGRKQHTWLSLAPC